MTIPNLPTDNLYKFLALSGVAIVSISIVLFVTQYTEIHSEIDIIQTEIVSLREETKFLEEDMKILQTEIDEMPKPDSLYEDVNLDSAITAYFKTNSRKLIDDKNLRDYLEFLFKYENQVFPAHVRIKRMEEKYGKNREISRTQVLKSALIEEKTRICGDKLKRLTVITALLVLFSIGGCYIAKFGFMQWFLLVQKPSDEKLRLELERLKKEC